MSAEDTPLQDVTTPVSFVCPDCGKTLKARMELAGKKVKCTQCGSAVVVPSVPVSESVMPDQRKWWFLIAGGAVLTVSAAVVGVLLWVRSSDSASPSTEQPYQSQLQAEIDKVKADQSIEIDVRHAFKKLDKTVVITDKDLAALTADLDLRILNLDGTEITDAGLKYVARVTSLEHLSLTNTGVTNAGLAELKTLTNLNYLRLDNLPITGAGLAHLKTLPQLRELSLYKTAVRDADLAPLEQMYSLEIISLDDTSITNAGLRHLAGLINLKKVKVWNTKVNSAGIEELRKSLPQVNRDKH